MKKTYKTFNGENRNCFFKVGKALVEAHFTPTYTTDNEFVQKAIEDSFSFKAGETQLVTPSMEWIKIDRDENGFATDKILNEIAKLHIQGIPIALRCGNTYEMLSPDHDIYAWRGDIERCMDYTHYMVLPKAPEV